MWGICISTVPWYSGTWIPVQFRGTVEHGSLYSSVLQWNMAPCTVPCDTGTWLPVQFRVTLEHGSLYSSV